MVVAAVVRLDAATVLLQWAAGGLFFLWVTSRRREVGLGYGWLLRGVYGVLAVGALVCGVMFGDGNAVREVSSVGVAAAAATALVASVIRRKAGVSGEHARHSERSARVAAMTGIDRSVSVADRSRPEFPPWLDLVAPLVGLVGLLAAGEGDPLSTLRILAGALFLGAVSDAMLLGHWYLVQPGLGRAPLNELVRWVGWTWFPEVALLLVPTGMASVWSGSIDDGYGGLLGWFWAASAVTTIVLVIVTTAALRERAYAAVMAATGLLYLAILTGFGTDLIGRALLQN